VEAIGVEEASVVEEEEEEHPEEVAVEVYQSLVDEVVVVVGKFYKHLLR
jgi:hypothetical protein